MHVDHLKVIGKRIRRWWVKVTSAHQDCDKSLHIKNINEVLLKF
jgi:hypothetical protein